MVISSGGRAAHLTPRPPGLRLRGRDPPLGPLARMLHGPAAVTHWTTDARRRPRARRPQQWRRRHSRGASRVLGWLSPLGRRPWLRRVAYPGAPEILAAHFER